MPALASVDPVRPISGSELENGLSAPCRLKSPRRPSRERGDQASRFWPHWRRRPWERAWAFSWGEANNDRGRGPLA